MASSTPKIVELPDEPLPSTDEEARRRAAELRAQGNQLFGEGRYTEAVVRYTEALGLSENKAAIEAHLVLSNRAACYLKTESYEQAVDDCNEALKLQPTMMKALFRRGQAYDALGKMEEALKDLEAAVQAAADQSLPAPAVQKDIARLRKAIEEKREREKEEVLGACVPGRGWLCVNGRAGGRWQRWDAGDRGCPSEC